MVTARLPLHLQQSLREAAYGLGGAGKWQELPSCFAFKTWSRISLNILRYLTFTVVPQRVSSISKLRRASIICPSNAVYLADMHHLTAESALGACDPLGLESRGSCCRTLAPKPIVTQEPMLGGGVQVRALLPIWPKGQ
jgi:hypothetical protein